MVEVKKGLSLIITPAASAELVRQASFAGTPGSMYLELLEDTCNEAWLHIKIQPGDKKGVPIARTDGVTVFVSSEQVQIFRGLRLNYYGDLSGGGFLISTPEGTEPCACGGGFRYLSNKNN